MSWSWCCQNGILCAFTWWIDNQWSFHNTCSYPTGHAKDPGCILHWPSLDHAPRSMVQDALRDTESVAITDVSTNAMTKTCATVQKTAKMGPFRFGSLWCKVDTTASGNVMPLHAFVKLFPKCISTDGRPFGLHPSNNLPTAYNECTVCHLSALDIVTEWKPKGYHLPNQLHTWWYVMDTPGPSILGQPSFSNLQNVQLNSAVHFTYKCRTLNPVRKPTTEWQKGWDDLMHLWETAHITELCGVEVQTASVNSTQHIKRPQQGLPCPLWRH